jgi:hypothetical protein
LLEYLDNTCHCLLVQILGVLIIFVDTLSANVNSKLAPKYLPNQRCGMTRKEFVEMLFAFSLIVSSKIWN